MDAVKTLYTKCLQCLMRDARLKLLAKQEVQMLLIKQALEIYVHQALHDVLFKFVGSLEAINMEAVDADQLLSVILFLLLKTDIPNWVSNLCYISSFSVCVCVKEELAYCLSSFQAAVE
ncbi:hypothetical protein CRUP_019501, partial [Coryphaenoides rupestris]